MTRAASSDAAAALLGAFIELGVRHIVLSPGSRSQALALLAAEAERRELVRLHVRIDERVAGYLALGIGRETGVPAVLICTSGTAVANLHPAVLEAHHAGVPLIAITADRPPELRGVGANQTTRQPGIFGAAVRFETDLPVPDTLDDGSVAALDAVRADAVAAMGAALGPGGQPAGPVHLNAPYREPLAGAIPPWFDLTPDVCTQDAPAPSDTELLEPGPRTVVIAGADAGARAEEVAHAGGWPLIAEVVSGARFGRNLVHGYRSLLAETELAARVQRAIVFGHPTLSREVTALLSRADVQVIAVRGPGEPLNLNGQTRAVPAVQAVPGAADRDWTGAWMRASREASIDLTPAAPDTRGLASAVPEQRLTAVAAELDVIRAPIDREALVDAVWRASWPHDRLMFGSSRLVRVADRVLGGKKVPVHANRGLAGIDGTVATAFGIASASQNEGAAGVTRVLLGDLALLHDVGALLLPPGEVQPRLQVIVGNDGGGTIFDALEVAELAAPEDLDRVMYTPHAVDLGQLAAGYGWDYLRITGRAELDQALTSPVARPQIIEVPLPR